MRLSRVPIAAMPLTSRNILRSNSGKQLIKLKRRLSDFHGEKEVLFFNSGVAAFYTLLKAIKETITRNEVIVPAYTAGSLIVAIKKAGLTPVLCDIALKDFNMDLDKLQYVVNEKTLAIVAVHMFGIPQRNINELKRLYPGVVIIEDCCQAMGSSLNDVIVGNEGTVSFYSFNKGKNIPTFNGGCLQLNDDKIKNTVIDYLLKTKIDLTLKRGSFLIKAKMLVLSVIVNKYLYSLFSKIIVRFKDVAPPDDIVVKPYTHYQAGVAASLLKELTQYSAKRYKNGYNVLKALGADAGLSLPIIAEGIMPAFNRLPIIFNDKDRLKKVERAFFVSGFEVSRMYKNPLHLMFPELGYDKGAFVNAEHLAEHLLTIPCHPMMGDKDIEKVIKIIKGVK